MSELKMLWQTASGDDAEEADFQAGFSESCDCAVCQRRRELGLHVTSTVERDPEPRLPPSTYQLEAELRALVANQLARIERLEAQLAHVTSRMQHLEAQVTVNARPSLRYELPNNETALRPVFASQRETVDEPLTLEKLREITKTLQKNRLIEPEFGRLESFRFIETPPSLRYEPSAITRDDPLGVRGRVGVKFETKTVNHNPEWMADIEWMAGIEAPRESKQDQGMSQIRDEWLRRELRELPGFVRVDGYGSRRLVPETAIGIDLSDIPGADPGDEDDAEQKGSDGDAIDRDMVGALGAEVEADQQKRGEVDRLMDLAEKCAEHDIARKEATDSLKGIVERHIDPPEQPWIKNLMVGL